MARRTTLVNPSNCGANGTRGARSAEAVSAGLRALAEHGLAERRQGGWVRGPADPARVAQQLGAPELLADILARDWCKRAEWRALLTLAEVSLTLIDDFVHPVPHQDIADQGVPLWASDEAPGPPVTA
ncbi:hypothetical protein FLW53_23970 [Microbispora sp. SCL1-1]|uniref:hypothetical protein n=1 Tax=unclassified Microbispora TaxID=2614687 RepID=UPI00115A115E|nr:MULTISPECIES: hypothetical protein [unclassified Microbispora]NJP27201.1 hypothetical protein [Microbispora sp. CL1-1]TQS11535.1 hypothetical protein FLW53_23970 [Microbispora sp. SCL1-1]